MNIFRVEYVWLDAEGNARDKTKIIYSDKKNCILEDFPIWTFDGSSTGQADTNNSDLLLKPVKVFIYNNTSKYLTNHYLVLCEVFTSNNEPHLTNYRNNYMNIINKTLDHELLFGIEQEYIITELDKHVKYIKPYNWESEKVPYLKHNKCVEQGDFYCGIGGSNAFGRQIVEEHIDKCLELGIKICGTNAEVTPSQWEYQIGPLNGEEVADQLIVSRYLLKKIAEKYNADITFHPKPLIGWNGSGGHTNFSTKFMRDGTSDKSGLDFIIDACEKLKLKHKEHIEIYGKDNDKRLCGKFETSNMDNFSYGVADRSCSIRIPQNVYLDKKGYLEDRRPASNLDPYLVCGKLAETICL